MSVTVKKRIARVARHNRVRKKVKGSANRPRLVVFRSARHLYAQLIDDDRGVTLGAASSLSKELSGRYGGNVAAAKLVGELLGTIALKRGIVTVVFDRNGYRYHGRIKALADAVREKGVRF